MGRFRTSSLLNTLAAGVLACLSLTVMATDPAVVTPPPVTGSRSAPTPSWGKPLPYPVVIADRKNNRLIEVAPNKEILWQFDSPNLKIYHGNDDVYFSPDGHLLAISEEDNQDIHLIDYDKRELVWSYGVADVPGVADGYMNFPDDVHVMNICPRIPLAG